MFRKVIYYLTHWEVWHWFAKYIVIGPVWLWLCIKAKSPWFFTSSNPGIVFGGFLGENKRHIYAQLPAGSFPKSIYITPRQSFTEAEQRVVLGALSFPVVVKPDVGMMGLMFRKVESRQQLRQYHAAMKTDYIIQEYIDYPIEVSVFYYRIPGEQRGHISGFIRKEPMQVMGDGVTSLRELISKYPRAQFRKKELLAKHENKLDQVLHGNETFILSDALNLSRGGRLINLQHEKDAHLLDVFDKLSHHTNFFYGRYDIKCRSVDDLKRGENFSILEFNGCGGEAHHVYSGYSFLAACRILIQHWNILYKISQKNKINGTPSWNYADGIGFLRTARRHFDDLRKLDHTFLFKEEKRKSASRTIRPDIALPATNLQQHVA